MLRADGVDAKTANKRAECEAEAEVTVWHCRNCAEHGCGCCGTGDISFNVVGEGDWALKAANKATTNSHLPITNPITSTFAFAAWSFGV